MEAGVGGEFGVEGGDEPMVLLGGHGGAIGEGGEDVDTRTGANEFRGADEDSGEGVVLGISDGADVEASFKAIDLATEGVAFDIDIHEAEEWLVLANLFGHENHAGASAPNRFFSGESTERVHQIVDGGQLADGGAFAAGNNEAIDIIKLMGEADFDGGGAELVEHFDMLDEGSLES